MNPNEELEDLQETAALIQQVADGSTKEATTNIALRASMKAAFAAQTTDPDSQSTEESIASFEEAYNNHETLEDGSRHPRAQLHAMKNLEAYLVLNDWGQATDDLSPTPTIHFTNRRSMSISSKFTPYFCSELQIGWVKWLESLEGQDLEHYDGPQHSWQEGIEFRTTDSTFV
ncbi:hypothetical protein B0H19DRAFT_1287502 [Mycena capillaripes]|nr:hypothetical protein B0H19DRAFT_1287502 [Mycena capillaripes]